MKTIDDFYGVADCMLRSGIKEKVIFCDDEKYKEWSNFFRTCCGNGISVDFMVNADFDFFTIFFAGVTVTFSKESEKQKLLNHYENKRRNIIPRN